MQDVWNVKKIRQQKKQKNNATETAELVFKSFALEDKVLIDSYTKPWNLQCSDLSFANLFIWGADGKMEYAEKNNVLYIKLEFKGVPVFLWALSPNTAQKQIIARQFTRELII